jgi:mRNA interferase MazF
MALRLLRYGVYWCDLSPTFGHQVSKTRPCIIISSEEMNDVVGTALVAPITTKLRNSPFRLKVAVHGQVGDVLTDQIKTIDQRKIKGFIATLSEAEITSLQKLLYELLAV